MKKKISGIYCIINIINEKKYIGSSKNISLRYDTHFSLLRNNKHKNKHLQNSVNKYGIENFIFKIIEIIDNNQLIFREQYHINKIKWGMLYNQTKIAGSGGGDVRSIKLYLLDLQGNKVQKFPSGLKLAKFLGKRSIIYNKINTKSIIIKKYRIVTPYFYKNNIDIINSWNVYSSIKIYKHDEYKKHKFVIFNTDEKYTYNTYRSISKKLNITHQRVSQIYKILEDSNENNYFHKKSGFYLAFIK